jgi:type I restriction-modification system DNA methylase subunit/DNA-binding transcriptional regulator YiaG
MAAGVQTTGNVWENLTVDNTAFHEHKHECDKKMHMGQMNMTSDLARAVREALNAYDAPIEVLAATIGVAPSTITRWKNGSVEPNISTARRILQLIEQTEAQTDFPTVQFLHHTNQDSARIVEYRRRFSETLRSLRETIHRSGNISSRNEALSELTKLLFSHVMVVAHGHRGLPSIQEAANPAIDLKKFVRQAYKDYLPASLSSDMDAHDFELHIREGSDDYARELARCFEPISSDEIVQMFKGQEGVDALNDAFALFLSQAFHDEKELGQYLTPPNVVSFMTRLALSGLAIDEFDILMHPDRCEEFGVILDPSCGTASFLSEVVRTLYPEVKKRHGAEESQRWVRKMTSDVLVGIDKSDRMLAFALTSLALLGAEKVHLKSTNSLRSKATEINGLGDISGNVGLILTNPPFGAEFSGPDLLDYRLFSEWAQRRPAAINSELLFMERYLDWLRPGGIVSAIVPDSILFNKGIFADLRCALGRYFDVRSSISLPPVTFASAGTSTKTSVLTLQKRKTSKDPRCTTYFAVCDDVGYGVSSRGAQRTIIASGRDELPSILEEATGSKGPVIGRSVLLEQEASRWDANFNKGLPNWIEAKISAKRENLAALSDVVRILARKGDPRRLTCETFDYIEISNVDAETGRVTCKALYPSDAPSRARKRVLAGDILFSTVRPDRKCIGVVPQDLDGAYCSTGFAVLEPKSKELDAVVVRQLLISDFVTRQVMRHNVGISYPSVDEQSLGAVVLPCSMVELLDISELGKNVAQLGVELARAEDRLKAAVGGLLE